jgi:hypothetical protein
MGQGSLRVVMRILLIIWVGVIVSGIVFFTIVGLTHS